MNNKEKNFVSAVLYVHNSEKEIKNFLSLIITVLENNFEHSEIICVNDFSSDNSVKIIKSIKANTSNVSISIINMGYFHGLEVSMNAGLDIAIGDYVFEFDNINLLLDEKIIMNIYQEALSGYDLVSASSDIPEKITSKLFYKLYAKYAVYSKSNLRTEAFRILSRRMINRIGHMNKTVPYRKAVYAYSGLKSKNIVYHSIKQNILEDQDPQEIRMRRELATDSLLLFTNIGYKFSIAMSILMLIMTIITACYTIGAYILSNPAAGWTSTILFLAAAFFGVFAVMAIIIKYLQLILGLVFKRQQYCFESIEKVA